PEKQFFDFAKDLFPILVTRGSIYASSMEGFWVDVGRIDGYLKAKKWLMDRITERIPYSSIVDATLEGNVHIGENVVIKRGSKIVGPVTVGDNVVIDADSTIMPYSSIGNGVTVRGGTVVDGAVLFENNVLGANSVVENSMIAEDCILGADSRIQSDVLIGSHCLLEQNVSVIQGSRLWPNTFVIQNSLISGTLRSFIPRDEVYNDPLWSLRTLTSEEAFYFNRWDGNQIIYTGFRARSLLEFCEVAKQVDVSSIEYHLRRDVKDFRRWASHVLGDVRLSEEMEKVKREFVETSFNKEVLRNRIIDSTNARLDELVLLVNKTKLYK
ncbi:MAG: hypothetical protein NTU61_00190, partial [Candidatus Altiarchaeota archaeon]|nr:hypothetical protein [Candidatus Altiarchaeota archaeon]